VLYDYIGCNPSKGGLFRSGPILKGDGVVQNWLGHPSFEIGTLSLAIRRMPAFFETFPVILIDQGGTVRADIPFRRAESRYSMEETNVVLYFSGGILNATEYSTPSLVKDYARKAQFGQIFTFDKKTGRPSAHDLQDRTDFHFLGPTLGPRSSRSDRFSLFRADPRPIFKKSALAHTRVI
jgi:hypothetical protein